jgi:hypothetical protein
MGIRKFKGQYMEYTPDLNETLINKMVTDGTHFFRIMSDAYFDSDDTGYQIKLQNLETDGIFSMSYNLLWKQVLTRSRRIMPPNRGLTVKAMRLLPFGQLEGILECNKDMEACKTQLNSLAENIPKLCESVGNDNPLFPLHYFDARSDFYVQEFDGVDAFIGLMFFDSRADFDILPYYCRSIVFRNYPYLGLDGQYRPLTLDEIIRKHEIQVS